MRSALFGILLLLPFAFAQSITILTPIEGMTITQDPTSQFSTLAVEWQMSGDATASFSLDGQPPVLRFSVEPVVFFVTPGGHQLIAQLVRPDGTPIEGSRVTRSFTVTTTPAISQPPFVEPAYPGAEYVTAPIPTYEAPPSPYAAPTYPGADYVARPTEANVPAEALPIQAPIRWDPKLIAGIASALIVLILGSVLIVIRGKKGEAPGGIDAQTYHQVVAYLKAYQSYYPPNTLAAELTKSGYNQETITAALLEAQTTLQSPQPSVQRQS
ncbi:hypothetical protein HY641_04790 [Candidatus Woesearchaeota archaeon]|nr:hypothetical protein [Candidatus Woesearchaeota archaeon]